MASMTLILVMQSDMAFCLILEKHFKIRTRFVVVIEYWEIFGAALGIVNANVHLCFDFVEIFNSDYELIVKQTYLLRQVSIEVTFLIVLDS